MSDEKKLDGELKEGAEGGAFVAAQSRHEAELAPTTVVHEDAGDNLALDVGDDLLATGGLLALRQRRDGLGAVGDPRGERLRASSAGDDKVLRMGTASIPRLITEFLPASP